MRTSTLRIFATRVSISWNYLYRSPDSPKSRPRQETMEKSSGELRAPRNCKVFFFCVRWIAEVACSKVSCRVTFNIKERLRLSS